MKKSWIFLIIIILLIPSIYAFSLKDFFDFRILGYASGTCPRTTGQDSLPPLITINNPQDQQIFKNKLINISGTALDNRCDDSGLYQVKIKLNDDPEQWLSSNYLWNLQLNLYPGKNIIQATAIDNFNNINTTSITVYYDIEKPIVNLISPINDTYNPNSQITFTCSATDNVALDKIEFWLYEPGKGFYINETRQISGLSDTETFIRSFSKLGNYAWNCKYYDKVRNSAFGNINGYSAGFKIQTSQTCTPGTIQSGTQCLICNSQGTSYTIDNTKCNTGICDLNGQCSINQGCNSECNKGERVCDEGGYKICEDNNGCYKWSQVRVCPLTQLCSNGYCSSKKENTCQDNTLFNQCSKGKPEYCNNGILINDCNKCGCNNNGVCLEDGSCISTLGYGVLKSNEILERLPYMLYIPKFNINQDEKFSLNLENYVKDPKNKPLTITFFDNTENFNSENLDCNLINNRINCNPKNINDNTINLIASNGIKKLEFSLSLNVLKKQNLNINNKPFANAGSDVKTTVNSYFVLDGSKSYDLNEDLLDNNLVWYENEVEIGNGKNLKSKYNENGMHTIKLVVTNSKGLSSEDTVLVDVISKVKCRNTKTKYYPEDTICDNKWPSQQGQLITINSQDYSCNLIEVCDDSIDYIIEDAIDCCDGTPLTDPKKFTSCNFANKYSNDNSKKCQSLYLIKSLGASQLYMQDYFEAEMCCKGVEELCSNKNNLYTAKPIPNTENDLSNLKCYNSGSNNPPGEWISDNDLSKNNIALSDVPSHVSLNKLSTGTCVDYSFSLTTLLRKLNYKKDEVISVESPNHAYNLVKLPLDKKYTVIDTTGNNEPGIVLGSTPYGYRYCENIKNCYNDNGRVICPKLSEINGCEKVKENFVQETRFKGFEISQKIQELLKSIWEEIKA